MAIRVRSAEIYSYDISHGFLGMLVTLMGSFLCCFVVTWHSHHWPVICSIILFIVGNQYFPLIICFVLVVPRCSRWCASLMFCLCRLLGTWSYSFGRVDHPLHATYSAHWCNVWILLVIFPVPGKDSNEQFLKLGIFASFFFGLIYNDIMLGFQDIFDYSSLQHPFLSLTMGVLIGSRVGLHHPFHAHGLARSRHLAFTWPIFQFSVAVAWLLC